MDELIAFVRAQLDEQESTLADIERCGDRTYPTVDEQRDDIAAKRRILDEHASQLSGHFRSPTCRVCMASTLDGPKPYWSPCRTVKLLAQPYAGRPGWREEWAL